MYFFSNVSGKGGREAYEFGTENVLPAFFFTLSGKGIIIPQEDSAEFGVTISSTDERIKPLGRQVR